MRSTYTIWTIYRATPLSHSIQVFHSIPLSLMNEIKHVFMLSVFTNISEEWAVIAQLQQVFGEISSLPDNPQ